MRVVPPAARRASATPRRDPPLGNSEPRSIVSTVFQRPASAFARRSISGPAGVWDGCAAALRARNSEAAAPARGREPFLILVNPTFGTREGFPIRLYQI